MRLWSRFKAFFRKMAGAVLSRGFWRRTLIILVVLMEIDRIVQAEFGFCLKQNAIMFH